MKKIVLLQGAIVLLLVFFLFGLLFFRRDYSKQEESAPAPAANSTSQAGTASSTTPAASGTTTPPASTPDSAKEGEENFLENFVAYYNTFIYGKFLNIEQLYPSMTDELEASEKTKVAQLTAAMPQKPPIRTVISHAKKTIEISYDAPSEALILEVEIEKDTYAGAYMKDQASGLATGSGDSPLLRENGDVYTGKFEELLKSKETQAYRIRAVKQGGQWLVESIQKVS
jgi:cytoskeletal protein RodZ